MWDFLHDVGRIAKSLGLNESTTTAGLLGGTVRGLILQGGWINGIISALVGAIAAGSAGLVYIGQVAGSTTDVNLALGGTYSKIVLVGSVFRSGAGNATVAVSDDGTTFGTARALNATGSLFSMSLGSVEISGTGLAATNKTITPSMVAIDDVDGGTGSSTVFSSGGTETSETGVTTHLRFDSTHYAVAYQWTVYGVP